MRLQLFPGQRVTPRMLAIFLALFLLAAEVPTPSPPSEVVILATVHAPTRYYPEARLAEILARAKPDLVLLELDPSFFDAQGNLKKEWESVSLETKVAVAYAKGTGARLRPYDIEGRNAFFQENDYFTKERKLDQEVRRLHDAGQLSPEADQLFQGLLALSAVRDACGGEGPEVLNSAPCDTAIEKKHVYGFQGLRKIVALTPALKGMAPFASLADAFWVRRNAAMVSNVVRLTKELRPRRALVLAGFEHRGILRQQLVEQAAKDGFVLREFWE